MVYIDRAIGAAVKSKLFRGKVIVIYGARQVGKTTLVRELLKEVGVESAYFNCDEIDVRTALTDKTSTELRAFLGNGKLVILDEAQRVRNIGLVLKLLIDRFPELQIVATGSSSFDLSNEISEPLTGRKFEFHLYPFSLEEVSGTTPFPDLDRMLPRRLVFGMYPEVFLSGGREEGDLLREIAGSYLYKDVLSYQRVKNPEVLEKLLRALALQLGNEVSYNELSATVGVDKKTVANYLRILEKAFIIFRLGPLRRNLRSELKKLRKVYFYDVGIRNAVINNLNPLELRQDVGALWENFMIAERRKRNGNHGVFCDSYFWRTHQQQEIDYLEEREGRLAGFEFKWHGRKYRVPRKFLESYPGSEVNVVTRENYRSFVIGSGDK
jgi:predicted AAA+ superfamily ATPase